jgi:hypothetical protein
MPFPLRRERRAGKGLPLVSMLQELYADFVIAKISEMLGAIGVPELSRKHGSIPLANTEGDDGADIAKHCPPYRFGELVDILMREREREAVLARLGQNALKRVRGKRLELVNDKMKIYPLVF